MTVADQIERTITEPLSWDEIVATYPDQWVCMVEAIWRRSDDYAPIHARVVGHGTRGGSLDMARPWRNTYRRIDHFYTGNAISTLELFALGPRRA